MNRDNQQETGSVARIGWLAGIIDGEGSITLLVSHRDGKDGRKQALRMSPRVIIGNTDPGIIGRVMEVLDDLGITRYVKHDRPMARDIPGFHPTKAMTTVYVEGFDRVQRLLSAVLPHIAGEKRIRAEIILRFVAQRIKRCEDAGKAKNISYTKDDLDIVIEFLQLTRSPNIERVTRLLNDYTQEARLEHRREMRRGYYRSAADRGYVRPSRYSLVSRENVRDAGNEHPPSKDGQ